MTLDFNQLEPDTVDSTDRLKQALLSQLPRVLATLFPHGQIRGKQFFVGDFDGNPGKSLVIELEGEKAGMGLDFATNDGGDIFEIWARARGYDISRDFPSVINDVKQWLDGHPNAPLSKVSSSSPSVDDLGPHTGKWDYTDAKGQLIACVYRYDPPSGKEFRPWDVKNRKTKAPDPRPLYNQVGMAAATEVVLVEGEKSADALIDSNIVATTTMNGAKAPIDKTDWSPLTDKHVVIWPDNDQPGRDYAQAAAEAIQPIAASVSVLTIPDDKPQKWDAADAVANDEPIDAYLSERVVMKPEVSVPDNVIVLSDWLACERFTGKPKAREWLVEGVFPMAQVSLLAASGGVGKSYLLAQLAREVALFNGFHGIAPTLFGGKLATNGAAVYFTAEDDAIEMHLRLNALGDIPDKLYTIPLPDAGGVRALFTQDPHRRCAATTDFWDALRAQLKTIADLRVIIFDPLQPLCLLDLNMPENAQFVCSQLVSLAAETKASVIVSHHYAKREAATAEQAREAIRGSGGLVDGVRATYALWTPLPEKASSIYKALEETPQRNGIAMGGIVKANGRADLSITPFVRDENSGLLVDRKADLIERTKTEKDVLPLLCEAIGSAASVGQPYTKSGLNGVYERRHELPDDFHSTGKHKLIRWIEVLLQENKLIAAIAPGQTTVKWLDIPGGPVAKGEAEFVAGHIDRSSGGRKSASQCA